MNYAHWHLMLNHFPIVGMLFGLAALAIPVYFTGENAHEMLHGLPGVSHDIIDVHEQWGTYTLIASLITGILAFIGFIQLKKSDRLSLYTKVLIPLLALITTGLACYTGHLGGQIRHTEIRPGFVPAHEEMEEGHEHHHHDHEEPEEHDHP